MNLEEPIMPADYVDSVLSAVEEVLDQWAKEHAPQEIYDLVVDYMMMMRYLASAREGCTTNWDNQNILDYLPSAVRILDKMNFRFHDLTGGEIVPHRVWLVENGFRKPEEPVLSMAQAA